MKEYWPYIVTCLVAWLATDLLIPHITKIAYFYGKVDKPGTRKIHEKPIPRLGGVAIFLGFLAGICILELLQPGYFFRLKSPWLGIICGGSLMFLLGVWDDLSPVPAKIKFTIQIIIALLVYWLGVRVEFITNPFGGLIMFPKWLSVLITVFWLVGITNTINLIDGLDGLAAGVSIIASITLSIIALQKGQILSALIAITLAGGTIGFLRYNFNPAKIFMGDSGSLFLGFTLSAISITGVMKIAATVAVILPLLILGIPILDTAFAILRRSINKQPIFQPDKKHIHHRLLSVGFSQKKVVIIIYSISALLGGTALYLSGSPHHANPVIIASVLMFLWGIYDLKKLKRSE